MRTRWDDIEVLRAIDGLQEQHGGDPVWLSGREVMNGIAGSWVAEPELISGFAYELDLARNAALLTFEVSDHAAGHRTQNTDFYLQNVRKLALTISGRDRARGRVIQVPLPDPDQDDGHRISYLILGQIAGEIEQQYSRELAVVFLEESGIILDKIPAPPDFQPQGVADVLTGLERWGGSDGRRALRGFIGRWLGNQLHTGPGDELRRSLLTQLARQGWHVRNGTLVTGDPHITDVAPGIELESLHPWVWDPARKLWDSGHRRHAVQAAASAMNERLQDKVGRHDIADDKLIQEAFSANPPEPGKPRLRIPGDPRNPTVASRQRGVPQFGVGCFWVIRNPATHETAEWPSQEALEQLAALSVLARLIERCEVATHAAALPASSGTGVLPAGSQPGGAGLGPVVLEGAEFPLSGPAAGRYGAAQLA